VQEPCIDERVEHALAQRALDAEQPVHLLDLQSQSRHLQILCANSCKQLFE
jgi:hypothetical protein